VTKSGWEYRLSGWEQSSCACLGPASVASLQIFTGWVQLIQSSAARTAAGLFQRSWLVHTVREAAAGAIRCVKYVG
jgi:hypothetical protein